MSISLKTLYQAPAKPWPVFHAVNDTIRGGASTSHWKVDRNLAHFYGNLDIKTLGGAGFASQCTIYTPPLNLLASPYSSSSTKATGLVLRLRNPANDLKLAEKTTSSEGSPTTFVLTLKNVRPADRTDGRKESVVNFEYHWDMTKLQPNSDDSLDVTARWNQFVPTYRGREDKSGIQLDPSNVTELSFMCRSGFGAQSGDYSLTVESLSVLVEPIPAQKGFVGKLFSSVQSFCSGISSWIRALWRREDRGVRLA